MRRREEAEEALAREGAGITGAGKDEEGGGACDGRDIRVTVLWMGEVSVLCLHYKSHNNDGGQSMGSST